MNPLCAGSIWDKWQLFCFRSSLLLLIVISYLRVLFAQGLYLNFVQCLLLFFLWLVSTCFYLPCTFDGWVPILDFYLHGFSSSKLVKVKYILIGKKVAIYSSHALWLGVGSLLRAGEYFEFQILFQTIGVRWLDKFSIYMNCNRFGQEASPWSWPMRVTSLDLCVALKATIWIPAWQKWWQDDMLKTRSKHVGILQSGHKRENMISRYIHNKNHFTLWLHKKLYLFKCGCKWTFKYASFIYLCF
jgi:hypothetical protein